MTNRAGAMSFLSIFILSTTVNAAVCSFARTDEKTGYRTVVETGELKLATTSAKAEIYTAQSGRFNVVLVMYRDGGYDLISTDSKTGAGFGSPWTPGSGNFPIYSKDGGPDSEYLEVRCSAL